MIKIRFRFYGGAREVGRSCILLEHKGYGVLMDCGIKLNPLSYPRLPDHVDSMILSHAHLDHSGMVPALYKRDGPPVYATDLTFEISHLLQRDSMKINKLRKERSVYSSREMRRMQGAEVDVTYGVERKLTDEISFKLLDAGHIPGSASILLQAGEHRVLYTGDIQTNNSRLLKGATDIPHADVLLIESTYGDRIHPDRKELEKIFLDTVDETLSRGGTALVPAFAVGRSQEMLLILDKIDYPVYLDGMSKTVTSLFLQYSGYLRDAEGLQEAANRARWVENNSERKKAVSKPSVIVTTSGMLTGGPVMQYLHHLHRDEKSSILLTGYQVEGTNGRLLMDEDYVIDPWGNKKLRVDMMKHQFDFSAHAGRRSLEKIVKKVDPGIVIVVHGDEDVSLSFAEWLKESRETYVPSIGDEVRI
ncbi:MAG: MBL fold metallo-hydrolase [Candidatus Altiarchaeota archaeon]|nr:MBL fold metallo-hydrolase [Candidatus Altiarchaeota archaeon]